MAEGTFLRVAPLRTWKSYRFVFRRKDFTFRFSNEMFRVDPSEIFCIFSFKISTLFCLYFDNNDIFGQNVRKWLFVGKTKFYYKIFRE